MNRSITGNERNNISFSQNLSLCGGLRFEMNSHLNFKFLALCGGQLVFTFALRRAWFVISERTVMNFCPWKPQQKLFLNYGLSLTAEFLSTH